LQLGGFDPFADPILDPLIDGRAVAVGRHTRSLGYLRPPEAAIN
jgi:hypothetical protein